MADEIDIANERVEVILDAARKVRKPAGPPPNGHCYNCRAPVAEGARFCDVDCRDDWEKRKQLAAAQYVDGAPRIVHEEDGDADEDAEV